MVQVDHNLEFSEDAFRFLINQMKDDLPSMTLPRWWKYSDVKTSVSSPPTLHFRQLMSYHDWLEHLGRGRPAAFEVSNMKKLKEIFEEIKLVS